MNHLAITIAAAGGAPLVLVIVFWVLLILWAAGAISQRDNPNWPKANSVILIIELAILGYCCLGVGF